MGSYGFQIEHIVCMLSSIVAFICFACVFDCFLLYIHSIQALVSPFLLDDTAENTDEDYSSNPSGK